MGRVTTGVYKGVHEDCEPPCNAAQASTVVFPVKIPILIFGDGQIPRP